MAQTVQILRTTTVASPPTLLPGAFSAILAPGTTKLYIGSPNGNLLLLSSDPADIPVGGHYIPVTGGIISGTAPGYLQVVRNFPIPAPTSGVPVIWAVGADNENALVGCDAIGTSYPAFVLRRARGQGTPALAAVQTGDQLGSLSFRGCTSPTTFSGERAAVTAFATEPWSTTAQGANLLFFTTPAGGTVTTNTMTLDGGGNLTIPRQLNAGSVFVAPNPTPGVIQVTRNTIPTPAPTPGVAALYAVGGDGEQVLIGGDAYGNAVPTLLLRRANGTGAARTVSVAGDILGVLAMRGYINAPDFSQANTGGRIAATATETWSATNQGSRLSFHATANGTASFGLGMTLQTGLTLGLPPPVGTADNGTGTLIINANAAPPALGQGIAANTLMVQGTDGTNQQAAFISTGANNNINFYKANGTLATPAALVAGDVIGRIQGAGRQATKWSGGTANIQFTATEPWNDTASGTSISISPGPTGGTIAVSAATFNRGLTLGVPRVNGADNGVGSLIANANTAVPVALGITGNVLQMQGADATACQASIAALGGNPNYNCFRANGTGGGLAAVANGDTIGNLKAGGWNGASWFAGSATLTFTASEAWTASAQGSAAVIWTTPVTTVVPQQSLTVFPSGNITILGGTATKPGGGSWVAPSDPRLKQPDVRPYQTGLDAILALDPISFKYNGRGGLRADDREYVGLDADAVADVFPSLVGEMIYQPVERDDEGEVIELGEVETYRTIDSSELIYTLIVAVKELHSMLQKGSVH